MLYILLVLLVQGAGLPDSHHPKSCALLWDPWRCCLSLRFSNLCFHCCLLYTPQAVHRTQSPTTKSACWSQIGSLSCPRPHGQDTKFFLTKHVQFSLKRHTMGSHTTIYEVLTYIYIYIYTCADAVTHVFQSIVR